MLSRLFGKTATTLPKIRVAVDASWAMLLKCFKPVSDEVAVATCGDEFEVVLPFTPSTTQAAAALNRIETRVLEDRKAGKGQWTKLHDSALKLAGGVVRAEHIGKQTIVVVVTDGADNKSEVSDPGVAGQTYKAILGGCRQPVWTVVVAVTAVEKELAKLKAFSDGAGATFVPVNDASKLGEALGAIGAQLSDGVRVEEYYSGGLKLTRVVRTRGIAVVPYQVAVLIDVSGSMSESVEVN